MKSVKEIVKKTMKHLKEDGIKDTLYISVHFIKFHLSALKGRKSDYKEIKISAKEEVNLTKKEGPVVYIIAAVPYYDIGGGQRCAQLAKTFNKMSYQVKYLYSHYSYDQRENKVIIPVETHLKIDEKAIEYVKKNIKKEDIFVFEAPLMQFEPLLDIAIEHGCKIIYENIDNWETSLGKEFFNRTFLKKILSAAHVLTGTAKPLVNQLEQYLVEYNIEKKGKSILYLPNAVDEDLFCGVQKCEKPDDLIEGEQTFLYYGSLWGEWFDWDLIISLAERHPEYSILLIGNVEGIQQRVKSCPSNIHFLGLKAQVDLPAYLQYVDYALIPFKRGEIGDYVSPLKIFEYISMYCKVLCTSLPDVAGYPNVYLGDSVEEWEEVIRSNYSVNRDAADDFIEKNTWFSRVTKMIESIGDNTESILKGKLAVVILNYNNRNVIFKCLNSLLAYKDLYDYEIIVVDNGSTDGSYELILEKYNSAQVKVYRNTKNGCSSGRNLGVSKTEREYVLFLDSDQWATNSYWLKPYENVIEQHPDFGAIGWAAGFFNPSGTARYTVDDFEHRYMPPQALCRKDIGYLGSGGMLVKTDDFREIEGFDLFYDPTCYEDTDISLKFRHEGKEIYYCTYLGVIHLPHQTTNAGTEDYNLRVKGKRDYFVEKWKRINPDLLNYVK